MGNTYGVEPFDASYGSGFNAGADNVGDIECDIVEDDGVFTVHDADTAVVPDRLAFVDGTMRTEARLTRIEEDGTISQGLVGVWAVGAVLAEADMRLRTDHHLHDRVVIFCADNAVKLPAQPAGWRWTPLSVRGDIDDARSKLRTQMRDAEGSLGEALSLDGWLTVIDGPLSNVRKSRNVAVVGYVKTHHRRMLELSAWTRVPELRPGQRSSMFAVSGNTYAAYLRIADTGPWASPWAGIVRIEVPFGADLATARDALTQAAAWLPRYASAGHRDPRAPVNLTPIGGLERVLHRATGNSALALRAVRSAILQLNAQPTATTPA